MAQHVKVSSIPDTLSSIPSIYSGRRQPITCTHKDTTHAHMQRPHKDTVTHTCKHTHKDTDMNMQTPHTHSDTQRYHKHTRTHAHIYAHTQIIIITIITIYNKILSSRIWSYLPPLWQVRPCFFWLMRLSRDLRA